MSKLLYSVGNLFTGYPFGVEAERDFGSADVFGPFNSENAANTFMHKLVENAAANKGGIVNDTPRYVSVKVVKIVLPQAGQHIVRNDSGEYEYAV